MKYSFGKTSLHTHSWEYYGMTGHELLPDLKPINKNLPISTFLQLNFLICKTFDIYLYITQQENAEHSVLKS